MIKPTSVALGAHRRRSVPDEQAARAVGVLAQLGESPNAGVGPIRTEAHLASVEIGSHRAKLILKFVARPVMVDLPLKEKSLHGLPKALYGIS
jgi:hypothetical protein